MKPPILAASSLLLYLLALPAAAQTPQFGDRITVSPTLISLDTPSSPDMHHLAAGLNFRFFGGKEGIVYSNVGLEYGIAHRVTAIIRGTAAEKKVTAVPGGAGIRHGGSDVEVLGKVQFGDSSNAAALIGLDMPSTAAQSKPVLTLGGAFRFPAGNHAAAFVNPRAVFLQGNTIAGVGLGLDARIARSAQFIYEWTAIITGHNTIATGTGTLRRLHIYGVALRFSASPRPDELNFDLGYTNAVGRTTGSGLTPGLGNSGAFYLAVSIYR